MLLAAFALATALAAADTPPADAAPAASTTQTTTAKPDPKKNPNRIVCVEEPNVGSIIPKRTCRTQAEWDRRSERDRASMSQFQNDHANN